MHLWPRASRSPLLHLTATSSISYAQAKFQLTKRTATTPLAGARRARVHRGPIRRGVGGLGRGDLPTRSTSPTRSGTAPANSPRCTWTPASRWRFADHRYPIRTSYYHRPPARPNRLSAPSPKVGRRDIHRQTGRRDPRHRQGTRGARWPEGLTSNAAPPYPTLQRRPRCCRCRAPRSPSTRRARLRSFGPGTGGRSVISGIACKAARIGVPSALALVGRRRVKALASRRQSPISCAVSLATMCPAAQRGEEGWAQPATMHPRSGARRSRAIGGLATIRAGGQRHDSSRRSPDTDRQHYRAPSVGREIREFAGRGQDDHPTHYKRAGCRSGRLPRAGSPADLPGDAGRRVQLRSSPSSISRSTSPGSFHRDQKFRFSTGRSWPTTLYFDTYLGRIPRHGVKIRSGYRRRRSSVVTSARHHVGRSTTTSADADARWRRLHRRGKRKPFNDVTGDTTSGTQLAAGRSKLIPSRRIERVLRSGLTHDAIVQLRLLRTSRYDAGRGAREAQAGTGQAEP